MTGHHHLTAARGITRISCGHVFQVQRNNFTQAQMRSMSSLLAPRHVTWRLQSNQCRYSDTLRVTCFTDWPLNWLHTKYYALLEHASFLLLLFPSTSIHAFATVAIDITGHVINASFPPPSSQHYFPSPPAVPKQITCPPGNRNAQRRAGNCTSRHILDRWTRAAICNSLWKTVRQEQLETIAHQSFSNHRLMNL